MGGTGRIARSGKSENSYSGARKSPMPENTVRGSPVRDSKEEFCIIHFSHPEFQRCAIMDRHLQVSGSIVIRQLSADSSPHQALAPKHPNTLFLHTSVKDCPFLVTRLGVKVLPCVISFVNGNAVDRYARGDNELPGVPLNKHALAD